MESHYIKYLSEKEQWIKTHLGDEHANEMSPGWNELAKQFEDENKPDFATIIDMYSVNGYKPLYLYEQNIRTVSELLDLELSEPNYEKSKLVMLLAKVVGSLEAYLSATFIERTTSIDHYMRRLLESDPVFSKRIFSLKELYSRKENIRSDIKTYLQEMMFHNIAKVKPMYRDVLSIDFGDSAWLYRAVAQRHDCVHRAGLDLEGNPVKLVHENIRTLIKNSNSLVDLIENKISEFNPEEEYTLEELFPM